MSDPIEDYALIGDCETAALVSLAGSVDWLCWPRFDSGACFAALVGTSENGRWLIEPVGEVTRVTRRYIERTLVLERRIETAEGIVTVVDFMPRRAATSDLVRLVRGERGRVRMRTELILRFDYGRAVPWVSHLPDGTFRAIAGPDMVLLHTPVPLTGQALKHTGEFEVQAGETMPFVLTYGPSHVEPPQAVDPEAALAHTIEFWTDWASRCRFTGEWSDTVLRSLITLKALTYAPTGGIVAAPTTSLPEKAGGVRNWDYRYCWLRDATLTLLALMNAGYFEEARGWRAWLLRAAAGAPSQLQIMYGLAGERRLAEYDVPWLCGYDGARPVRVGNAAHDQLQLDVYGEVMDALHQGRLGRLDADHEAWAFQCAMLDHLLTVWREPDEGIWEVRGPRRHFTYSKVMAWVAFDRGIRTAEAMRLEAPADAWRAARHAIHEEVCSRGFDPDLGSFVQAYDTQALDASLLLIPTVGFLKPDDPRITGTIAAVERHLLADGFVRRYDTSTGHDGLPPGEGAFLACTFWLADAYVLIGRRREARALFERLLSLRNDVGLLPEEYDPVARRMLGNFPQAFSHIAIVNTAHNLSLTARPAEQRAAS